MRAPSSPYKLLSQRRRHSHRVRSNHNIVFRLLISCVVLTRWVVETIKWHLLSWSSKRFESHQRKKTQRSTSESNPRPLPPPWIPPPHSPLLLLLTLQSSHSSVIISLYQVDYGLSWPKLEELNRGTAQTNLKFSKIETTYVDSLLITDRKRPFNNKRWLKRIQEKTCTWKFLFDYKVPPLSPKRESDRTRCGRSCTFLQTSRVSIALNARSRLFPSSSRHGGGLPDPPPHALRPLLQGPGLLRRLRRDAVGPRPTGPQVWRYDSCGSHLQSGDFTECGDTWVRMPSGAPHQAMYGLQCCVNRLKV